MARQLTAGNVITKARVMLSDKRPEMDYRNTDEEMIGWLNDAINSALAVFPGLFAVTSMHTTVAGYLQTLINDRAVALMEVIGLPEADSAPLTLFSPGWINSTSGPAVNWMRSAGDPLKFMVYPPAPGGDKLPIRYSKSPTPLAEVTDVVPMPENYEPALVDYVVGRADMQNDEDVNSARSIELMNSFVASMKASAGG